MDVYNVYGIEVVGVQFVLFEDVSKYGIINILGFYGYVFEVKDLVEKFFFEEVFLEIVVMGCYVLNLLIFFVLKFIGRGVGNEIQFIDVFCEVCCKQFIYVWLLEGN